MNAHRAFLFQGQSREGEGGVSSRGQCPSSQIPGSNCLIGYLDILVFCGVYLGDANLHSRSGSARLTGEYCIPVRSLGNIRVFLGYVLSQDRSRPLNKGRELLESRCSLLRRSFIASTVSVRGAAASSTGATSATTVAFISSVAFMPFVTLRLSICGACGIQCILCQNGACRKGQQYC